MSTDALIIGLAMPVIVGLILVGATFLNRPAVPKTSEEAKQAAPSLNGDEGVTDFDPHIIQAGTASIDFWDKRFRRLESSMNKGFRSILRELKKANKANGK